MVKKILFFLFNILLSMVGTKAWAADFAVKNADGVTIYYNYINDGKELEVTYSEGKYSGSVAIPEEVTYMNRTRKVTRIGNYAFSVDYEFSGWSDLTSVTIPNSVTSIGESAFGGCSGLTSVTIPNSVTNIGDYAFRNCSGLTSVTIGNSVTSIGSYAFEGCSRLTSVNIFDIAAWCKIDFSSNQINPLFYAHHLYLNGEEIKDLVIPKSVTSIGKNAFFYCSGLTSVTIPNSVTSIGGYAFYHCSGLTSVTIPNSVTNIGDDAFCGCSGLTSVTIPNSVTSIGSYAFFGCDISEVISKIENPFKIGYRTFSLNTFNNATLYVPVGTIDKYKVTEGWKDFMFIEEGNGSGSGETPPEPKKCEKPTISYSNGKLTFHSATEGVAYQYSITDSDIKTGSAQEVQLGVTYSISVYATKEGFDNSETATATLCWIDVEPKTEGISNGMANVHANPVLIQSNGNVLKISGAPEGSEICVYNMSGQKVGSAKVFSQSTDVFTSLHNGDVGIVKIGEKAIKVIIK